MKQTKWIKRVDGHKQRYHCGNYGSSPLSELSQKMFGRPPHMLSELEYNLLINKYEGKHQAGATAHKKVNFSSGPMFKNVEDWAKSKDMGLTEEEIKAFLKSKKKKQPQNYGAARLSPGDKPKIEATLKELKEKQKDDPTGAYVGDEVGYTELLTDLDLFRSEFGPPKQTKAEKLEKEGELGTIAKSEQEQELRDKKAKEEADKIAMRSKPGVWRDWIPRPNKDEEPENFGMAVFSKDKEERQAEKEKVKEKLFQLEKESTEHPGDPFFYHKKQGYERALSELNLKVKLNKSEREQARKEAQDNPTQYIPEED